MRISLYLVITLLILARSVFGTEIQLRSGKDIYNDVRKCAGDVECIKRVLMPYYEQLVDLKHRGIETDDEAKLIFDRLDYKFLLKLYSDLRSREPSLAAAYPFRDSLAEFSYDGTCGMIFYISSRLEGVVWDYEYMKSRPEKYDPDKLQPPNSKEVLNRILQGIDSLEFAQTEHLLWAKSRNRDRARELGLTYSPDSLLASVQNNSSYHHQVGLFRWLLDTWVENKRLLKEGSTASNEEKATAQTILDYLASQPVELAEIAAEAEAILADMKDHPLAEPNTYQVDLRDLHEISASLQVILSVLGIQPKVTAKEQEVAEKPMEVGTYPYFGGRFPPGYPRWMTAEERQPVERLLRDVLNLLREEKYEELVDTYWYRSSYSKGMQLHEALREAALRSVKRSRDLAIELIDSLLKDHSGWIQVDDKQASLTCFERVSKESEERCSINVAYAYHADIDHLGYAGEGFLPPSVAAWLNLQNPKQDYGKYVYPGNRELIPHIQKTIQKRMAVKGD